MWSLCPTLHAGPLPLQPGPRALTPRPATPGVPPPDLSQSSAPRQGSQGALRSHRPLPRPSPSSWPSDPWTRCPRHLCPAPCSPQDTGTGPRPLPRQLRPRGPPPCISRGTGHSADSPLLSSPRCREPRPWSLPPGLLPSCPPLDPLWPQTETPCTLPSQAWARPGRSPRWPVFPDGHGGDHHGPGGLRHSGAWMQRRTALQPAHDLCWVLRDVERWTPLSFIHTLPTLLLLL